MNFLAENTTLIALALFLSQVLWISQHIVIVHFFRDKLINTFGEQAYVLAFATFSLLWFGTNTYLHSLLQHESPVVYGGFFPSWLVLTIRWLGFYILLMLLVSKPSPFDIGVQRTDDKQRRNEGKKIVEDKSFSQRGDQSEVFGLTKIMRHPRFMGFGMILISYILKDIHLIDLAYVFPPLCLVVIGIRMQEIRMKKHEWYKNFFESTSNIPFWALISGKTLFSLPELKSLLQLSIIPLIVISLALVIKLNSGFPWSPTYPDGGWFMVVYIAWLAVVDVIAMLSGKYIRAT